MNIEFAQRSNLTHCLKVCWSDALLHTHSVEYGAAVTPKGCHSCHFCLDLLVALQSWLSASRCMPHSPRWPPCSWRDETDILGQTGFRSLSSRHTCTGSSVRKPWSPTHGSWSFSDCVSWEWVTRGSHCVSSCLWHMSLRVLTHHHLHFPARYPIKHVNFWQW